MSKCPTKQEIREELEEWFKSYDADGSGKVDSKEVKEIVKAYYDWKGKAVDDAKLDRVTAVTRHSLLTY